MSELVTPFEKCWAVYPRKVGKGAARKAWAKMAKTHDEAVIAEKILISLVWQREQPQWQKDGGQYIPHFSTFISQERWDDEPMLPMASGLNLNDKSRRALEGMRQIQKMPF